MMIIRQDTYCKIVRIVVILLFDKVVIRLDSDTWGSDKLVIETGRPSTESLYIREMELGGKKLARYRISHEELVKGGVLRFILR